MPDEDPVAPRDAHLWVALLAVQLFFGSLSVAGKFAFRDLSPPAVAALRVTSAAVILVMIERTLVPRSSPRPRGRDLGMFLLFAVLGVAVNQLLFLEGLSRTTAVNATLLVTTIPAFTLLVGFGMGRDRPTMLRVLGVTVSLAGVALLVGLDAIALGGANLLGNAMVTVNAFSYAVYLVLSRPYLQRYDPLTVAAWSFIFGAAIMLVIGAPSLATTDWAGVTTEAWAALAWIVAFPTVATYALNNWVLRYLDSGTVAAFIPLQPVVAAVLAVGLLDEPIALRTVGAGAVIIAGVVVAARAGRSRRAGKTI